MRALSFDQQIFKIGPSEKEELKKLWRNFESRDEDHNNLKEEVNEHKQSLEGTQEDINQVKTEMSD